MRRPLLAVVTAAVVVSSCNSNTAAIDEADGLSAFSEDSLAKNIAELASDAFLGRKPFSLPESRVIARNPW